MNLLSRLYHFLGSVYFAIVLISTVAVVVVIGTFIESKTDSHQHAALLTYGHPLFALLLWGFFINILFSATRRWPFQKKHIPFLITHIGLLMILSGALIKNYAGVQGNMSLLEGGMSNQVLLSDQQVLRIEKRHPTHVDYHPLQNMRGGDLQIELLATYPHAQEKWESWIKGEHLFIYGLPAFAVHDWDTLPAHSPLPITGRARLHHPSSAIWEIAAGRTADVAGIVRTGYLQGTELIVCDLVTNRLLFQGALQQLLLHPQEIPEGTLSATLNLNLNARGEFDTPALTLILERPGTAQSAQPLDLVIPLQGQDALLPPHDQPLRWNIDLKRIPLLLVVEGSDTLLMCGFDAHGRVFSESFQENALHSVVAYDQGYGGYAVQATLPFPAYANGRVEREATQLYVLKEELRKGVSSELILAPPLALLLHASELAQVDFVDTLLDFLICWDHSGRWLYPVDHPLPDKIRFVMTKIDWSQVPPAAQHATHWVASLANDLEPAYQLGRPLQTLLKEHGWPLPFNDRQTFADIAQQLFAAGAELPILNSLNSITSSPEQNARWLSAYLLAYGIDLHRIYPPLSEELLHAYMTLHAERYQLTLADLEAEQISLEAPLTMRYVPLPPLAKLEDNQPIVSLRISADGKQEQRVLGYDRFAQSLKWPVLEGRYLLRFQPAVLEIPYQVRLRQARQVNYANSVQPLSYESELLIENPEGITVEQTLSMNHVYETATGYRFYLANMTPADERSAKRIQLVVNRDPAKYLLTYPGAVILTLGILLLFWLRPYRT